MLQGFFFFNICPFKCVIVFASNMLCSQSTNPNYARCSTVPILYIVAFSLPKSDIFRNFLLPFFEFLLSPYHHPPTQISHIHTHFCVLTSDRFSGGSHIDHQHWTHQIRNNFDLGYTFSDRAIGRWLSWIYPITFVVIFVLGGFALGWVNTNISRIYIQRRHTKWDLFGGSAKSDEWFSARGSRSIRAYRISLRDLGKFV